MNDLLNLVNGLIPAETIDGANVRDTAKMVDLEIGFSPVVKYAFEGYQHTPSPTSEVQLWSGNRYALVDAKNHDFQIIRPEELKVMRARYLLLRGYYQRNFRALHYSMQQKVGHYYFPDGLWLPAEGSELARKMEIQ